MNRGNRPLGLSLPLLMFAAVVLRLGVVALLGSHDWYAGGDGPWYVRQGWLIGHLSLSGPPRTVGPMYPLVLAAFWQAFPGYAEPIDALSAPAAYLLSVRVLQIALGTATVALAFFIATGLGLSRRSALIAAAAVALGPAFAMEPFLLHTETLFIALLAGSVLLLVVWQSHARPSVMAATGVMCALAALTRPVMYLFPLALCVCVLAHRRRPNAVRSAAALLLAFGLTVLPWHLWLYRGSGHWMPEGLATHLFMGSQAAGAPLERSAFHAAADALEAAGRDYAGGALDAIRSHPIEWVGRRARNLAAAVAQPHGTSDLGGPSAKAALDLWIRSDRSASGLSSIVSRPAFWLRLAIYLLHYAAIILAVAGAWATWRTRREWCAVYAVVAYLMTVHFVLTAIPRYLFPAEPFLWILAAAALDRRVTPVDHDREDSMRAPTPEIT